MSVLVFDICKDLKRISDSMVPVPWDSLVFKLEQFFMNYFFSSTYPPILILLLPGPAVVQNMIGVACNLRIPQVNLHAKIAAITNRNFILIFS
jgi:hypothetical protein